ncbi:acetyl-coenzyme A transporter 1-domain-containing protein [Gloeopeniophorella convolvens]|nr:acetyl-coenzyme A transporter 1-domain-containing protein [Gloeopeniophorella convolvens]
MYRVAYSPIKQYCPATLRMSFRSRFIPFSDVAGCRDAVLRSGTELPVHLRTCWLGNGTRIRCVRGRRSEINFSPYLPRVTRVRPPRLALAVANATKAHHFMDPKANETHKRRRGVSERVPPREAEVHHPLSPVSHTAYTRRPRPALDPLEDLHLNQRAHPPHGAHAAVADDEEVEMGLLAGAEHRPSSDSSEEDTVASPTKEETKAPLTREDKKAMVLLVVLYLIQGVPLGLAMDSLPFLLRERLSYSQIAVFTLSGYPYSLKLLWSPIVDAWFFPSIGRRRSWIIPMQTVLGCIMIWMSYNVQELLDNAADHLYMLTVVFTMLVVIAATQDIAVDGWSLTLLSRENLSYASTCQTIGLNTGWLMSFTVFLALNSEAFSAKWGTPLLTLGAYLRFWGMICFGVTLWLVFFQKERKEALSEDDTNVTAVYRTIWSILKLKNIQSFLLIHLTSKIGFAAHDAATSLKMVEKGLGKEEFAASVLFDFPIQIAAGYFIARWSRGAQPLRPWMWAFWPRLLFAFLAALIVWNFPTPPITTGFFVFLVLFRSVGELTSTTQFVCIGAFHARISDPVIGGTYITLLNTVTNLGGTWPRFFVLKAIDYFTVATCEVDASASLTVKAAECVSERGRAQCAALGGRCVTVRDGYFVTTGVCLALGLFFLVAFIIPTARKLQALPLAKWRVVA